MDLPETVAHLENLAQLEKEVSLVYLGHKDVLVKGVFRVMLAPF